MHLTTHTEKWESCWKQNQSKGWYLHSWSNTVFISFSQWGRTFKIFTHTPWKTNSVRATEVGFFLINIPLKKLQNKIITKHGHRNISCTQKLFCLFWFYLYHYMRVVIFILDCYLQEVFRTIKYPLTLYMKVKVQKRLFMKTVQLVSWFI